MKCRSSAKENLLEFRFFYDAGDIIQERFRKRREKYLKVQSGFLKQHMPTTGDDNEIDGKRLVVGCLL